MLFPCLPEIPSNRFPIRPQSLFIHSQVLCQGISGERGEEIKQPSCPLSKFLQHAHDGGFENEPSAVPSIPYQIHSHRTSWLVEVSFSAQPCNGVSVEVCGSASEPLGFRGQVCVVAVRKAFPSSRLFKVACGFPHPDSQGERPPNLKAIKHTKEREEKPSAVLC